MIYIYAALKLKAAEYERLEDLNLNKRTAYTGQWSYAMQ